MTEIEKKECLTAEMDKAGISLDQEKVRRYMLFYDLLTEKNKVMNLTAITDFKDVVEKHYVDSVLPAVWLPMDAAGSVLDLGCGAGFPGIPLKIFFPELKLTLLDSVGKKIQFVRESLEMLRLKDVQALHARAEDLAHDLKFRQTYDLCISRAVANLSTLSEYCLPFVKTGGIFAAYKTANSLDEIKDAGNAVKTLGGKIEDIKSYKINDLNRKLVIIRKIKETPVQYPRKAGTPSRKPL